jgi:hypothetical protein
MRRVREEKELEIYNAQLPFLCVCTDTEQAATLLLCIREVLGSNLGQETYLSVFCGFPQSLQRNTTTVLYIRP